MKPVTSLLSTVAAERTRNDNTQHQNTCSRQYLRRKHVLAEYPISGRTLTKWQQRHIVPFHKIGKTVLFRRDEIEAALNRYRIAAIGELPQGGAQ